MSTKPALEELGRKLGVKKVRGLTPRIFTAYHLQGILKICFNHRSSCRIGMPLAGVK